LKLAVLSDLLEERWPSMDLVAEMLVEHAGRLPGIEATCVRPRLPRTLGDLVAAKKPTVRPLGLALARYALYPLKLPPLRPRFDFFHVADHSYAHLALGLPPARTGVFCHDVDAFRPLFENGGAGWRRALAALLLRGMRRASVVFYSTEAVRLEIEEHRLVDAGRLVAAPYGIASEFQPEKGAEDAALSKLPPFVLHVGSLIPRKNPQFLLKLFAALRRSHPTLELVQIGGEWDAAAQALLDQGGLKARVRQLRGITRDELAALYRSAAALLLPSTSEGFGLPVIEALACGALVVVSDIPVLRQVGGDGVLRCAVDDLDAWRDAVAGALAGRGPDLARRLAAASKYTWGAHAATIAGAYAELAGRP
jgi:glycosyltransferase involved in cell wall biosynthesis